MPRTEERIDDLVDLQIKIEDIFVKKGLRLEEWLDVVTALVYDLSKANSIPKQEFFEYLYEHWDLCEKADSFQED